MATFEENRLRFQEIADRGLQDQLPKDKRAIFDEAARRGLIDIKEPETDFLQTVGANIAEIPFAAQRSLAEPDFKTTPHQERNHEPTRSK